MKIIKENGERKYKYERQTGNRDKDIRRYEHDSPGRRYRRSEFYGDQFAEVAIRPEETEGIESLNDAECLLFTYVPDVKKVHEYTRLLGECATAHDLASVVSIMLGEPRVNKDTVVKGTFIEVLLPFASRLTSGAKVDNVRQQINNMLMRQGRGGK